MKRGKKNAPVVVAVTKEPKAQLAALDFRLGKGVGAKKERERLKAKLASSNAAANNTTNNNTKD
jgi:hypothetical protein